jgi:hypothetical protein
MSRGERPPDRLKRRRVHGLKCADLVDAMGRLHPQRCHILDLVTPTPGRSYSAQR